MTFRLSTFVRRATALLAVTASLLCVTSSAEAARGRPSATTAKRTFVADNGQLLRGPRVSTEVGTLPQRSQLQAMKNYGLNAIHVYAERSDYGYAAGARASTLDTLVQWTREDDLYLIITIGGGGINEPFITAFWNHYAGRYANETHVLYEIQNEPVFGAGVSQTVIDVQRNTYELIRSKAPNTPVLFFSYTAFQNGAKVIQDINALGTGIDWTKAGIAFHGYGTGGANATKTCLQYVQNAGYACFQTEFYVWPWGTGDFALGGSIWQDVDQTGFHERMGCSWLNFMAPNDVLNDAKYRTRIRNAGITWTPDFGTWPGGSRSTFGNSGEPWTHTGLTATLRIEAENFDTGGQGLSYNDLTASNSGNVYRLSEGVDVQTTTDTGGGYNLGWMSTGEWVEYTTYINNAGVYNLKLRVASPQANNTAQISMGGTDVTGNWSFAGTGGNQTWQTITKSVFLTPGQQVLRLTVVSPGFNLNWIEITPATTGAIANGTYKLIARNSGKAMDVVNSSTANGAAIQIWGYSATPKQKWTITHLGANEYRIVSVQTGKSIDIASYELLSGNHVQMYNNASSPNQRYIITPTDTGYFTIRPAINGLALEVSGGSSANGAIIRQAEYTGGSHQQWGFQTP